MLAPIAKIIAAVLAFFYSIIPNYGIAIILLTVLVMIIIAPLTIKSTRSMLAMQKLQPELKRLQTQHKNDRAALNEAVMSLYKEHGVSPLGGCLPMLLPFPVFFALFRTIDGLGHLTKNVQVNGVWLCNKAFATCSTPKYLKHNTKMYHHIVAAHGQLRAFGMDLSKSATAHHSSVAAALPYFALVLLMVGSQYYQQAQLTRRNPAAMQGPQAAMMKFLPIVFGLLFIRFPAGVLVYYATSNLLRILMQWAMYRYDPKVRQLALQDVKEVEAKTREIDDQQAKRPNRRSLPAAGQTGRASDSGSGAAPAKPSWRSLLSPPPAAADPKPKPKPTNGTRPPRPATKSTSGTKPAAPRAGAKPGTPAKGPTGSKPASPAKSGTANKAAGAGKPRPPGQPPVKKAANGSGATTNGAPRAANGSNGKRPPARSTENGKKEPATTGDASTPKAPSDQTAAGAPTPSPKTTNPTSSGAGRTGAARGRTPSPDPDADSNKRPRRGR